MSFAPPVKKDGFAYGKEGFYADASNHNCHRRASPSELQELLNPAAGTTGTAKDHPAHWYESQLIHYGLSPSKTKSIAKLRMLDAVKSGPLVVPKHLQKLEAELKKQWNKNERQAKKERHGSVTTDVKDEEKKATRGKAAKKPESATKKAAPAEKSRQVGKKRKADSSDLDGAASSSSRKKPAVARSNQPRARRSKPAQPGSRFDSRPPAPAASTTPRTAPRRPQMARRSRPFNPGNRFDSRPVWITTQNDEGEEPFEAVDEDADEDITMRDYDDEDFDAEQDDAPFSSEPAEHRYESATGTYEVQTSIEGEWSEYEDFESTVMLIHHEGEIWGGYDFGMFAGVIFVSREDIRESDGETVGFCWRGHENSEGVISYDETRQTGEITFRHPGRISGTFDRLYGDLSFHGSRPGHPPDRNINRGRIIQTLQGRWESYSEEEYEAARIGRWR